MLSYILSFLLCFSSVSALEQGARSNEQYIIINKAYNKLAYIKDHEIEGIYQVATGKDNALTPEGEFNIVIKAKNPYYRKKDIPGGDPRNPLGTRWMGLDALGTDGREYGIHGTNVQESVGKYVTNGCVRMKKNAVEYLYDEISLGAKVWIVNSPKSFDELARQKNLLQ